MATKSIEIPDTIEVKHPLDPLTPDELEQVIAIVRRETSIDERALFETVMLQEPDKSVVRAFRDSQAIRRDGSRHSGAKPLENPSFALGKPILLYAA